MPQELKNKFKELTFAGYYDDDGSYITEILKEDLISFLTNEFEIKNLKIV